MSAPGSTGRFLLSWVIAFTVICSVFLVLRFWAARLTKRRFYADDAFVILSFACTIANEGVIIWAIDNGLGKPSNEVPPDELAVQAKVFAIPAAMTWLAGSVCLKLSMLFLYLRIFSVAQFKRWVYALIAIVVSYGIAFFIVFPTNCQPVYQLWAPVPGGWCHDVTIEEFSSVGINLAIDLAIIILPMPILWTLKMPVYNKIFISIMFSCGLITIGLMCWRLVITAESARTTDLFFYLPDIGLVSELELWLGIIVVCIPTMKPLVTKYLTPRILQLKSMTTGSSRSRPENIQLKYVGRSQVRRGYHTLEGEQNSVNAYPQSQQATDSVGPIRTECTYDPNAKHADGVAELGKIHVRKDIESHGST